MGCYIYAILVGGVPRYIGKGTAYREGRHLKVARRDLALGRSVRKNAGLVAAMEEGVPIRTVRLAVGLPQEVAFRLESRLIERLGREDLAAGPLWNGTAGGFGGRGVSAATREKQALAKRGRPLAPAHREKIANGVRGVKRTPEERRRISEMHLGKVVSAETRERLRASHVGHQHSMATRDRMSASQRERWAKRKATD